MLYSSTPSDPQAPHSSAESIELPIYENPGFYEHFFSKSFLNSATASPGSLLKRVRIKGFAPIAQIIQIEINQHPLQGSWIKSNFDTYVDVSERLELSKLVKLRLKASKSIWIEFLSFEFEPSPHSSRSNPKKDEGVLSELFFGTYNPEAPIFFYHVPKTAGISTNAAMKFWFQDKCFYHYLEGPQKKDLPPKHALPAASCLVGHSSLYEKMAFEDYYSSITQRVSFFRDPFDRFVSNYFFVKPNQALRENTTLAIALDKAIQEKNSGFLDFLPPIHPESSMENYLRTHFLYVGLHESAQRSINHLAFLLGKKTVELPKLNLSSYDEKVPELRAEFRAAMKKEYELYDFVRRLHEREKVTFYGN